MFNSQVPYNSRASRQREQRRQKKEASLNILYHIDSYPTSSDDDSIPDTENFILFTFSSGILYQSI
jgi:hypothetical protein